MAKSMVVYITSAVAAALTIVGLILNAVSVGTDYWITARSQGLSIYFGLWRVCGEGACYFIGDTDSGIDLPI